MAADHPRGVDTVVTHPTRFWHALPDGRVQCDLCPRACRLHEGQRGLCFIRARENDQIVLTSYGRSSGFCVDPVEKKPLNHSLPGSAVLSFGTAGCNLACKFCQNWDISKSREMDRLMDRASPRRIAEPAQASGASSVAFTYNDPVVFAEYAMDTADACLLLLAREVSRQGFKVALNRVCNVDGVCAARRLGPCPGTRPVPRRVPPTTLLRAPLPPARSPPAVSATEQHRDRFIVLIHGHDVGMSIVVQVGDIECDRPITDRHVGLGERLRAHARGRRG